MIISNSNGDGINPDSPRPGPFSISTYEGITSSPPDGIEDKRWCLVDGLEMIVIDCARHMGRDLHGSPSLTWTPLAKRVEVCLNFCLGYSTEYLEEMIRLRQQKEDELEGGERDLFSHDEDDESSYVGAGWKGEDL